MTVEKFVDKLIDIDKIESKYEYAKAYMQLVLPKAMWAMKNYKAIEKEFERRKAFEYPIAIE